MEKDDICSSEEASELIATLEEDNPASFFSDVDIIQTISASFGLKILKNKKPLKELVSRMFPETIAKCNESPFRVFK